MKTKVTVLYFVQTNSSLSLSSVGLGWSVSWTCSWQVSCAGFSEAVFVRLVFRGVCVGLDSLRPADPSSCPSCCVWRALMFTLLCVCVCVWLPAALTLYWYPVWSRPFHIHTLSLISYIFHCVLRWNITCFDRFSDIISHVGLLKMTLCTLYFSSGVLWVSEGDSASVSERSFSPSSVFCVLGLSSAAGRVRSGVTAGRIRLITSCQIKAVNIGTMSWTQGKQSLNSCVCRDDLQHMTGR